VSTAVAGQFRGSKRFRVLRRIGSGGMGEVYEAYDLDHDTRVALKVLTTMTAETLLRFKAEFRSLRDLEHRNVVSFGELLEERGAWFFTMEFVDGVDFLNWVTHDRGERSVEQPTAELARAQPCGVARAASLGRRGPSFDEARLRDGMAQLARGVSALHAIGKVHCDIKPSNIRVSREGRVVLLDFGLVCDFEYRGSISDSNKLIGTPAFMSPEQAAMREVGPATDWYSVGAVLFLSLTGRLPFSGNAMDIVLNKQRIEPPLPSTFVGEVPRDLDQLCADLLRIDARARPRDQEVLRRLHLDAVYEPARGKPPATPTPCFVGRVSELAVLREAFDNTRRGRAATIYVHGESGVGKSALARSFAERMAHDRNALVLLGRCLESESVPFKGVDGLIDSLSRYLMDLPASEAAALLPVKAGLLTQVFPVLSSVEVIASAPLPFATLRDTRELRSRAFAAMRELLARLADRRPLILVIDDLQWSDAESLALLRELLQPPDPPPLMLIVTVRSSGHSTGASAELPSMPGYVRHLHLPRLRRDECRELAGRLLDELAIGDVGLADAIADEAGGHPLFVDTLARCAHAKDAYSGKLLLEEALWDLILALEPESRRILELVAVAKKPLDKDVVAHASGLDFAALSKRVSQLRVAHLLRGADGDRDSVEPYHDRVRGAVLAHLHPDERAAHHLSLAVALEGSSKADPEALATQWRGAGDSAKAAVYAVQAANQAGFARAFERAAELYALALELGIVDPTAVRRVYTQLGDALKNAGRSADAARAYLAAAERSATTADKLEMQRRAAEQQLLSGHVCEGLVTLRAVLAAVGLRLPATPKRALASLAFERAHLGLRGLDFRERAESEIASEELTRIDVSWSAAVGLSVVDHVSAADFQCRYLLQALRVGEPRRIARSLAAEAGLSATGGSRTEARTQRLLGATEALAARLGDAQLIGWHKVVAAMAAMLSGRWQRALELCETGAAILRTECTGVVWEIAHANLFASDCRWSLGELRELARRVPQLYDEARNRGDVYAAVSLRTGVCNTAWLVRDTVDEARRHLEQATIDWSHGVADHHMRMRELVAQLHIDLYVGDGTAAYARVLESWPLLKRAQLLRVELARAQLLHLRGQAALAAAATNCHPEPLEREALRSARALERVPMSWCRPAACLLYATIAAAHEHVEEASMHLQRAAYGFEQADMIMHAAASRRQLGVLTGGVEGAALIASADSWFLEQEVKAPARLAAMLAPGFAIRDG
jgi:serine/threonine protein kinase